MVYLYAVSNEAAAGGEMKRRPFLHAECAERLGRDDETLLGAPERLAPAPDGTLCEECHEA